jgi:Second Messenger Oligonucleotide or Dinucleotide Synthetase domain
LFARAFRGGAANFAASDTAAGWREIIVLALNATPIGTLDDLLDQICAELQLTNTQYLDAQQKYEVIGRWLSGGTSPLANRILRIYPQGSMALGTTVRPRHHEEFDLDLILLVMHGGNPAELRNAVVLRMLDHATYAKNLDLTKPRCVRLKYTGQFYLDVVAARPDQVRGGTFIEVPDKALGCWMTGNPLEYASWFESQCKLVLLEKMAQDPLPANVPAERKPILKRGVQLLKRHRDVVFDGSNSAPSSIILTTLAAHFYRNESSIVEALKHIIAGTSAAIERVWPGRIMLYNPANNDECLTDRWTDENYQNFVKFISNFRVELDRLADAVGRGIPALEAQLKRLFDEKGIVTAKVLNEFAKGLQTKREAGELRATSNGLALGVGRVIPRNTHYGR